MVGLSGSMGQGGEGMNAIVCFLEVTIKKSAQTSVNSSRNLLLPQLKSPGVWSGLLALVLFTFRDSTLLGALVSTSGSFSHSLKWLAASPWIHMLSFLGLGERYKLCTDWITLDLVSGENHELIGLDLG